MPRTYAWLVCSPACIQAGVHHAPGCDGSERRTVTATDNRDVEPLVKLLREFAHEACGTCQEIDIEEGEACYGCDAKAALAAFDQEGER